MTYVAVRELRNHTAEVIERARRGEEVTITVNGVPAATLTAVTPPLKAYLTIDDLMAMRPRPGAPVKYWDHEFDGDTTDDLGPIE